MRWFLATLILSGSLVNAQSDANQKTSRVEGTILSLNGEAVRKATVRLQGSAAQVGQLPASYSESTDSAGKFFFEDVIPGRYALTVEKTGFVSARYGARSSTSPGTELNLAAGMEIKSVAIKMTPQGVIVGKVADLDGDSVAGAQVQAMRYSYAGGRKQLQRAASVITNDLGEYRIGNLPPGRYYISASDIRPTRLAQDLDTQRSEGQEANITTYYPNGTDATNAAPVEVAAGGEMRGIDIRLLRAKVYTVRGRISGTSAVLSPALITLGRKEDVITAPSLINRGGFTSLGQDGTFEFRNVLPGLYLLQALPANLNGKGPANITGRVEVTVADANIEGLILPVLPGPEIKGTIKLEGSDIAPLSESARSTLTLVETDGGVTVGSPTAQIRDDGTFQFNAVGAGKYTLKVNQLPQGFYLKSARFSGQDVTHAPIDTTSGAGGTLDIVLSSKAADVMGSVQNDKGEALAGVMVLLWPKTPDASVTGGTRPYFTDQNGGFHFPNLAPGDYYVAAWEDLEPGLTGADFLSHFASEASAVKLAEGAHESKDLKLVPSDKVLAEIAKLP